MHCRKIEVHGKTLSEVKHNRLWGKSENHFGVMLIMSTVMVNGQGHGNLGRVAWKRMGQ